MGSEARMLGLTKPEVLLEDFLTITGWVFVALGAAAGIFARRALGLETFLGGLALALLIAAGLTLLVAASGLRQNRSTLDLGLALLGFAAAGALAHGITTGRLWAVGAAAALAVILGGAVVLRNRGIRARFQPQFFTLRQFETVIQIADTMIDADGELALHPIEAALYVDRFMARFESVTTEDVKQTLGVVEWLLPLAVLGRPVPFSVLGSHERRRAVEKVIGSNFPMFKDIARFLKLLACAGYYGSPQGMAQVGYRPFDERERSKGVDQTPSTHPDPFVGTEAGL